MEEMINKFTVFNELNEEIRRNIRLLYVFRDRLNKINIILVTNDDKVQCFGHNSRGILGFGHGNSIEEFTINEELSGKQIIEFKNSYWHTMALTCDGKLYCWGIGCYLGNGRQDHKIYKPELNEYLNNEKIIDMCCGGYHTLVLTSNKEVYAWGANHFGQIGNRSDDRVVSIPFKVNEFNGEKVKVISCGCLHSMALTESGSVYSWGKNKYCQLGLIDGKYYENKPKRIQIEVEIKKISCGSRHSVLLSQNGDIYVFGSNLLKQLGIQTEKAKQFELNLKKLKTIHVLTPFKSVSNHSEKFIKIASHYLYDFSAVLSKNGFFYVWGKFGEQIISEPKKTQFKSFFQIFVYFCEITYKSLEMKMESKNEIKKALIECYSLKRKYKELEENDLCCSICLEKKNEILLNGIKMVSTFCGHVFCKVCLDNALKARRVCPTCIQPIYGRRAYHYLHI